MTTGTRASFQKAIDKARKLRPQVRDLGDGRYAVSGHGSVYTVVVDANDFTCTCRAGELGRPCYHQGRVFLVRLSLQAAGVLPIPAAPAAPAAVRASDAQTREASKPRITWTESDDQVDYAAIYGPRSAA